MLFHLQELCGQRNLEFANDCFLVSNSKASEQFTPSALVYYRIKFGLLVNLSASKLCHTQEKHIRAFNPEKSLDCNHCLVLELGHGSGLFRMRELAIVVSY